MDKFKESLLLDNQQEQADDAILQDFMKMYGGADGTPADEQSKSYKTVEPTAEFCIKTKNETGEKVFLNICTADHIPSPKDITDNELIELIESEDPSRFRVPLSLGEPHVEVDKSGKGCTAYDIVISSSFCEKIKSNNMFMGFFMSVIMEGMDNKYEVKLSREWITLKNKKCMGTIQTQHIRSESKPWIMEMDPSTVPSEPSSQTKRYVAFFEEKELVINCCVPSTFRLHLNS